MVHAASEWPERLGEISFVVEALLKDFFGNKGGKNFLRRQYVKTRQETLTKLFKWKPEVFSPDLLEKQTTEKGQQERRQHK